MYESYRSNVRKANTCIVIWETNCRRRCSSPTLKTETLVDNILLGGPFRVNCCREKVCSGAKDEGNDWKGYIKNIGAQTKTDHVKKRGVDGE